MDYLTTFEDGSAAIAHHGVKGMKWGVWNDETAARYTLSKGSMVRRFTSPNEATQGTDMSKRFYVSQNQHDFDLYREAVDTLPSTSKTYKEPGKLASFINPLAEYKLTNQEIGLIEYEAVDDVHVAKGKKVLDTVLKDYGSAKLNELFDDYGYAYVREELKLPEKMTVNQAYKSKKLTDEQKKVAVHSLVKEVLSNSSDDDVFYFSNKNGKYEQVKGAGKKILDDLVKSGYDAVEDIEDQLSPDTVFKPTNPLIILNGSKFKVSNARLVDRDKYDSKTNK